MTYQALAGRRIAVLAADGFEKIELVIPVQALRKAGATVDIVSLRRGKIRGANLHKPDGKVRVTTTVSKADPAHYDGLLIPGGFINPDMLRQSSEARSFVRSFDATRKPIATLCHGPWVLASAGLLRGRTLASWPGIRDDVVNAGATWLDEELVRDGNLLTSRGPQDIRAFVRGILLFFTERAPLAGLQREPERSSPQRDSPPKLVLTAMNRLGPASLGTFLGLAAAGIGVASLAKSGKGRKRAEGRPEEQPAAQF